MKYVKKPVVIDAHQWNGIWEEVLGFLDEMTYDKRDAGTTKVLLEGATRESSGRLVVETLEGKMTANIGDYLICGTAGEFYFCKPDIFEKNHNIKDEHELMVEELIDQHREILEELAKND